ncbi:MAG: Ig-like domain-containing protein, partial [Chloroflexota bacterium]
VAVNSVTIIDTDDNSVQGSITNGATVTLDLSQNLALRAEATGVGSVQFYIDGNLIQTENAAPYSIAGDGGPGNLTNWNFAPGTYTLEVRPYPQSNGQGTVGTSLTATITIP